MCSTRPLWPLLLALLLLAIAGRPAGAAEIPKFREFPAQVWNGPIAEPDLQSHPDARMFRTRLREAAGEGEIDFAGHYVLAIWGCGTACSTGALVDARDGTVYFLPFTTIAHNIDMDEGFRVYETRPDSRLMVVSGSLAPELPTRAWFLEFSEGDWLLHAGRPVPLHRDEWRDLGPRGIAEMFKRDLGIRPAEAFLDCARLN